MRKSRAKNYYIELYNSETTHGEFLLGAPYSMNFKEASKIAKRLNFVAGFGKSSPARFYASQEFED